MQDPVFGDYPEICDRGIETGARWQELTNEQYQVGMEPP